MPLLTYATRGRDRSKNFEQQTPSARTIPIHWKLPFFGKTLAFVAWVWGKRACRSLVVSKLGVSQSSEQKRATSAGRGEAGELVLRVIAGQSQLGLDPRASRGLQGSQAVTSLML